ncbi:MAG: ribosome maturation factor RimM [Pseudomonadota bacterium]
MSSDDDDRVCVGAIAGAFGVAGEVRLKSFCADPFALGDYGELSDEAGTQTFTVQVDRAVEKGLIGRLSGVRSKEDADALKGTRLYAPRERLPELPDDEYYYSDLIGLTVVDPGGGELGTVKTVLNHGATDILEIKVPGKSETALLPFTLQAVPTVDISAGRIVADPPDGIF